ncbi:MAG: hypothetical protein Q3983_05425 [Capnocytophaga sp.]|nr:hypothetical protein [Capnocytophaga sp.]
MKLTPEIEQEIVFCNAPDYKLGEYIYMGMALVGTHRVCISVAYKIDYCLKKATQFLEVDSNIRLTHINKVKIGEKEAMKRFVINS